MIIVKLMGGLGNQMFQYAFGKSVALKQNATLKLDLSALQNKSIEGEYIIRNFGLNAFNIKAETAAVDELKKYNKNKIGKILDLLCLYLPFKMNNLYIREPQFHFFSKALNAPEDSYLDGYWQSEKYFNSIRKQLLNEFAPVTLSEKTIQLVNKIKNEQAVSIHVRRGDYVSITHNNEIYETCSEIYYLEAIKRISSNCSDPIFYVFSDEPEWFKKNIKISFPVEYVIHNTGEKSFEDLYLMSLCKHNIIANSTFSWWGAWLNQHADKMVIAPKNWFKNDFKNTKDLLPETWIQL